MTKIQIENECDAFAIYVNGKRFHFDKEDTLEDLAKVFEELGFEDVEYEEVY